MVAPEVQYLTYPPDIAKSYEVGVKDALFDRRLCFSLDAFIIDLDNYQLSGSNPSGGTLVYNGTPARPAGVEFEASLRMSRNFSAPFG